MFALYVAPISNIIASHGINHAQYADDTQLYIALKGTDIPSSISECFESLLEWFDLNGLSLNADKSEAVVLGTDSRHRLEGSLEGVDLAGTRIPTSTSVKSLGVIIDYNLTFDKHVDNICKSAQYHIRALRHIRQCISTDNAKSIAVAMVSSRLDYCNSVLYGTSASNIQRLQRVQNSLARVVTSARRRDHITPVLADLHWLPINARIKYKIAVLIYKTLTTQQPSYLYELLQLHRPARQLRSSQHNRLDDVVVGTVFAGRAFAHAAPTIWNSLPTELTDQLTSITVFKRHLKTYLYRQSFG